MVNASAQGIAIRIIRVSKIRIFTAESDSKEFRIFTMKSAFFEFKITTTKKKNYLQFTVVRNERTTTTF